MSSVFVHHMLSLFPPTITSSLHQHTSSTSPIPSCVHLSYHLPSDSSSNTVFSVSESQHLFKIEATNQKQAYDARKISTRRTLSQQIKRTVDFFSTTNNNYSNSIANPLALLTPFRINSSPMRGSAADSRLQHFEKMKQFDSSPSYHKHDSSNSLPPNLSSAPTIVPFPEQSVIPYRVCIATSDQKHADTQCPVYVQLHGDLGHSHTILLKNQPGKVLVTSHSKLCFTQGSVCEFGFEARDVGNITSISLQHDISQHTSATWRPERVTVSNENLHRTWSFLCPQWLNARLGNLVELQPCGDISAGRRASRRASRRLSSGTYNNSNYLPSVTTTPTENFQSIRQKFSDGTISPSRSNAISNGNEAGTRRVLFSLQKYTQTSSHMYLLGGIPALGEWDPQKALRMKMQSGLDGSWRGEWRLELEIDDDFDVIEYTYMIVSDTDNPDERSVRCPDRRRKFCLNSDESGKPCAEGGRITIKDTFGSTHKLGKLYGMKSQYGSTRPLPHHESVRTPLGKAKFVGGSLGPNHTPSTVTSGKVESVQRNLHFALESSHEEHVSSSSIESSTRFAAGHDEPERSEKIVSSEVDEISRKEWQQQLEATDDQIQKSEEHLLQTHSEVMYLKKRNSVSIGTSHVLLSPSGDGAEKTSPVSSDGLPEDEIPSDEPDDDEDLSNLLPTNDHTLSRNNEISRAEELEVLQKRDERTAEVAIDLLRRCGNLSRELETFKVIHSEQQEDFANKHADLVGLMMLAKEASAKEREALIAEREAYADRWAREFKERRKLFNTIQELRGNIRVFCRVRPLKSSMVTDGTDAHIGLDFPDVEVGEHSRIRLGARDFEFDHVFEPTSTQQEVYNETSGVVASVLDGYNVCVFAYGQTGSGKTHTMNGPADDRGVNFRALVDLFELAEERAEHSSVDISVSMMEIYNETLRDLIKPDDQDNAPKLEIRKDPNSSSTTAVHVPNLTEEPVKNVQNVWELMEKGTTNRSKGKTDMNAYSSRSHLILKVKVSCENLSTGMKTVGVLHLVDLAGSERLARSHATGERLTEAQNINKSLATLGDVFTALLSNSPHIPYRNSKLTYLLQDCLGGDSKTLMFVNISADEDDSSESLSSLQFAQRVAKIELGSAQKHTERTTETKTVQALQAREVEVKDLNTKLGSLQRDLKKKDDAVSEFKQRVRALENELKNSKRSMEEQMKRENSGSAKELRDLRAVNEKGQRDLKVATQKAREISTSKDEEIAKLKALLKTKEKTINELNVKVSKSERETLVFNSVKRSHIHTPNGNTADKPPLSRVHRSASTFTSRSRQVRFEDNIPAGELPPRNDKEDDPAPPPTPTPSAAARRAAQSLPRGTTIHGSRIQRHASRNNTVTSTPKRLTSGINSRGESNNSLDSNGSSRPARNTRLPRAHTTTMRPAQRAQPNSLTRTNSSTPGSGRIISSNLRRTGSTPIIQRRKDDESYN